jgi:uncharacterized metal-binding protein
MASGLSHDRVTAWLALPFGLLWSPLLGWPGVVAAGLAFLVGGLWLSPDLDTLSNATRRWGPLRCLWWPYRRLLPHRSPLSHSPFLGTVGRLLYMGVVLALVITLLVAGGALRPRQLAGMAAELWHSQRPLLLAALVGVEASAWLHLLQDGDPLPRWPRRSRGRRRPGRRSSRR